MHFSSEAHLGQGPGRQYITSMDRRAPQSGFPDPPLMCWKYCWLFDDIGQLDMVCVFFWLIVVTSPNIFIKNSPYHLTTSLICYIENCALISYYPINYTCNAF